MNNKQSLIQISRRTDVTVKQRLLLYAIAFVLSFGIISVILASLDVNAFEYFETMLSIGMNASRVPTNQIEGFVEKLVPMLIVSLGLSLAFRIKFWNIGGEGQFICGAIFGYVVAYYLIQGNVTSPWIIMLVSGIVGGLAGAVFGLIPAVLKVKFGTNETLLTLMLNYIALYALQFLGNTGSGIEGTGEMYSIFLDPNSVRKTFAATPLNTRIPKIAIGKFDLNVSLIIALLLFVLFYFYLKKSKHGYEMSVVGDSTSTARYAGMNVNAVTLRTVFVSAFLVGLAGALYLCSSGKLSESITDNVGFTGIVVAWLAKLNPVMIIVVSLLMTVLRFGSVQAAVEFRTIDSSIADVFQGIILFAVLACEFFINFKVIFHFGKKTKEAVTNE